jgi:hypothetical protein
MESVRSIARGREPRSSARAFETSDDEPIGGVRGALIASRSSIARRPRRDASDASDRRGGGETRRTFERAGARCVSVSRAARASCSTDILRKWLFPAQVTVTRPNFACLFLGAAPMKVVLSIFFRAFKVAYENFLLTASPTLPRLPPRSKECESLETPKGCARLRAHSIARARRHAPTPDRRREARREPRDRVDATAVGRVVVRGVRGPRASPRRVGRRRSAASLPPRLHERVGTPARARESQRNGRRRGEEAGIRGESRRGSRGEGERDDERRRERRRERQRERRRERRRDRDRGRGDEERARCPPRRSHR